MFQNKRHRYSHESRRDTVRRRPLPGIGAVRDPGRCQVDLLLGARTPRGRARRPLREGCGARVEGQRQGVRGQEDQARPRARGRDAVPPPRQPDHEGERHGRLLFQGRL